MDINRSFHEYENYFNETNESNMGFVLLQIAINIDLWIKIMFHGFESIYNIIIKDEINYVHVCAL